MIPGRRAGRTAARSTVLAGALASMLVLAACGSTADQQTAEAGAGGVKTDKGVTDTTITLGIMGDNTGVFKNLGAGLNAGNQLWADDVNAAGGICDRQIQLEIVDHGYKADTMEANGQIGVHTPPVIANGRLYVRDQELLSCYEVGAGK